MKYEIFARLYDEAKDYADLDMYIGERGWQDWMDKFSDDQNDVSKITTILSVIYDLSHSDLSTNRKNNEFKSRTNFSRVYRIPGATVQDWEYGNTELKVYNKMLLDYTFFISKLCDDGIL